MVRLIACVAVLVTGALGAAPPAMPDQYSAVILMRMPYIPIEMPLRVLTSGSAQKVEYYDGLEVDLSEKAGSYKFTYNNSKRVCMFSPSSAGPTLLKDDPWKPAAFLPPDLAQYTQEKDESINGIMCNKFTQYTKRGTVGTMDDHISFYWDPVVEKPVRWHMHARAVPFGSHTDEYILDFLSFQATEPVETDLALPKLCTEQPTQARSSFQVRNFLEAARALRPSSTSSHFEAFLENTGKSYAPEEHAARKAIFVKNMRLVDELNRKHAGRTTFKANKFMDMTKEEIMSFRGGKAKSTPSERRSEEHKKYVSVHETAGAPQQPEDWDWRTARPGVVGPVKDQAMCGSCWTYGITEPIESAIAIHTKNDLIELPEQFVLDCTWTNGTGGVNNGCDGGNSDVGALEIVRKFGGIIPSAAAYGQYLSTNGYCRDIGLMDVGAKITGWVDIKYREGLQVLEALYQRGPLSVGIQVPEDMLYYDTGVLQVADCAFNEDEIDHAVTLVGYGVEGGVNYWLIRNSWSTYWGDLGYIKIARGSTDCCVSCQAGYPLIAEVAYQQSVVV